MTERRSEQLNPFEIAHSNSHHFSGSDEDELSPFKQSRNRSRSLTVNSVNIYNILSEKAPETPSQALDLLHSLSSSQNNSPMSSQENSPNSSGPFSSPEQEEKVQRNHKKMSTVPNLGKGRKSFSPQCCPSPGCKPGEIIKKSRFYSNSNNQTPTASDTPMSLYTKGPSTFAAAFAIIEEKNKPQTDIQKLVEFSSQRNSEKGNDIDTAGGKFGKFSVKDLKDFLKAQK